MTRLIELLISLAIVAALFLIVGVLLPSSRHLSHSVETNRKLTIVYDTLNSLRRFKDWNPLVLRDPAMQLKLSGPETGVGARLDYTSQEKRLGNGSWEITDTVPRESVSFAITDIQRGTNKRSKFSFKNTGKGGRNVEITQTYDVDYGWNLIGRYAGLYVSSNVGEDIKLGLSRITRMLATVPNYDYAELSKDDPAMAPKLGERPAENLLVMSVQVDRSNEKVQQAMSSSLQWINKVIEANGLESAGPLRLITSDFSSESYSFDVAMPVRKVGATGEATELTINPGETQVKAVFQKPSRIAVVPFKGHMANLAKVRDALRGWALTRGYEPNERPYDVWKNGIDAGFTEEGDFEEVWAIK
ncbi:SRPBCC family protein [Montanilutibacter psychrotolerans]|uniref:Polyketide cyclase n=1 Tax=Montanilutibacter psychrotolerans TaxID=1327343 RepID=A0A3M8STI6_9GAMM|nr:SRPBCC family protein [Lysobacter psychrotolerans]RNF82534.1 polyketide cyclase [Lysobacter psychrotolerans]